LKNGHFQLSAKVTKFDMKKGLNQAPIGFVASFVAIWPLTHYKSTICSSPAGGADNEALRRLPIGSL
jgi:hypothetical protein